jgi:hypothetical protein
MVRNIFSRRSDFPARRGRGNTRACPATPASTRGREKVEGVALEHYGSRSRTLRRRKSPSSCGMASSKSAKDGARARSSRRRRSYSAISITTMTGLPRLVTVWASPRGLDNLAEAVLCVLHGPTTLGHRLSLFWLEFLAIMMPPRHQERPGMLRLEMRSSASALLSMLSPRERGGGSHYHAYSRPS